MIAWTVLVLAIVLGCVLAACTPAEREALYLAVAHSPTALAYVVGLSLVTLGLALVTGGAGTLGGITAVVGLAVCAICAGVSE